MKRLQGVSGHGLLDLDLSRVERRRRNRLSNGRIVSFRRKWKCLIKATKKKKPDRGANRRPGSELRVSAGIETTTSERRHGS